MQEFLFAHRIFLNISVIYKVAMKLNMKTKKFLMLFLILVIVFFAIIFPCRVLEKSDRVPTINSPDRVLPSQEKRILKLIAVGDIMLSRHVGRLIDAEGSGYPWRFIAKHLRSADITFGNLESPISTGGEPLPGKGIWFRADPQVTDGLLEAGFDVVSVANNHILDFQEPALLDTLNTLKSFGLKPVGGGNNLEEARSPVFMEAHGVKVAFLGYSDMADIFWSQTKPRCLRATEDSPGVAPLEEEMIVEDIGIAKQEADVVIVSMHWGEEYADLPSQEQRELAYNLVDAGANVLVGHHPHTLQGFEVYKGGIIAYSLGNFVFDQDWADYTQEGILLELNLVSSECVLAEVYPIILPASQPQIASGQNAERILNKIIRLSAELGTEIEIIGNNKNGRLNLDKGVVNGNLKGGGDVYGTNK